MDFLREFFPIVPSSVLVISTFLALLITLTIVYKRKFRLISFTVFTIFLIGWIGSFAITINLLIVGSSLTHDVDGPSFLLGIFSSILFVLLEFIVRLYSKRAVKKTYRRLSIVGILIKKRLTVTTVTGVFLLIGIAFTYFFAVAAGFLSLLGGMLVLLLISQMAFIYRIKHGLYGTSDAEAREIIQFILDNSEEIDFTDEGKPKKILTQEDMDYFKEETGVGVPQTVRESLT